MKKIFILIILLSILLLNAYNKSPDFSFYNYFNVGTITRYTNENSKNSILPNVNINGYGSLLGESIYFDNINIETALLTLKAKVEFVEYIAEKDLTILYCTTPLIHKEVFIKDKNINLQIASSENYTIIGWPMILGGF